ncbi:hypothetical protein GCM10023323_39810 [Streptomyces thinghirensis]|uniref:Uncharacterized protein n=1 Tax=Streptomyces thinghirensis TaxID=551547 RepID=A0ABP9T8F2_9ACTN
MQLLYVALEPNGFCIELKVTSQLGQRHLGGGTQVQVGAAKAKVDRLSVLVVARARRHALALLAGEQGVRVSKAPYAPR